MELNQRDRAFRGAVAVNNLAVMHLERGLYGRAIEALQDGMKLMKFVLESDGSFRSDTSRVDALTKNTDTTATTRATAFEVNGLSQLSHLCYYQSESPLTHPHGVHVQTLVYSAFDGERQVLWDLPSHPTTTQIFPIRFEEPSGCSRSGVNRRDPDLASAVLLYNLGVANVLEYQLDGITSNKSSCRSSRKRKLLLFAKGLLEAAFHVICANQKHDDTSNDSPSDKDDEVTNSWDEYDLPFFLLLVQGMYHVLIRLGNVECAHMALDDYHRLMVQYQETHYFRAEGFLASLHHSGSAPAA